MEIAEQTEGGLPNEAFEEVDSLDDDEPTEDTLFEDEDNESDNYLDYDSFDDVDE